MSGEATVRVGLVAVNAEPAVFCDWAVAVWLPCTRGARTPMAANHVAPADAFADDVRVSGMAPVLPGGTDTPDPLPLVTKPGGMVTTAELKVMFVERGPAQKTR